MAKIPHIGDDRHEKASPPPLAKFEPYRYVVAVVDRPPVNATMLIKIAYMERRGACGYFYYCVDPVTGAAAWFDEAGLEYPAVDPEMPVRRQLPEGVAPTDLVNPRRRKYTLPEFLEP
jgi:hypothetical protein